MGKYYFYTHLESDFNCRRVQALLDGKLPLTSPSRFNDPFDSQIRFSHAFTEESAISHLENGRSLSIIERLRMKQDPIGMAEDRREETTWQRWKTFCVSEIHDSLLMWSHYGKSHSGICLELEYDEAKLPDGAWFEKVRYTTHYPDIDGSLIDRADEASLRTLLLTKSIEWHYEKEWRLVFHNAQSDAGFDGLIDSPFKVTAILCGSKFVRGGRFDFVEKAFHERVEVELGNRSDLSDEQHNAIVYRHQEKLIESLRQIEKGQFDEWVSDSSIERREKERRLFLLMREHLLTSVFKKELPVEKFIISKGEFSISRRKTRLISCGNFPHLRCWGMAYTRIIPQGS